MTTAFCKQTHTFIFSDALVVVAYTPISRSRHFEIESEAPSQEQRCHIVVFQAVHPINEKIVIKSCHCIGFRCIFYFYFFTKQLVGFDILHRPIFRHLQY